MKNLKNYQIPQTQTLEFETGMNVLQSSMDAPDMGYGGEIPLNP